MFCWLHCDTSFYNVYEKNVFQNNICRVYFDNLPKTSKTKCRWVENVSASAQLYVPLSPSSVSVIVSWLMWAADRAVNTATANRGSSVGSSSSPLYTTVGLSQPGRPTLQKYHRMSRSESVAHSNVTDEPTMTLPFDGLVVIIRLSKTMRIFIIVFLRVK